MNPPTGAAAPRARVPLRVIVREWGRIGIVGVGGPPAHIALLRGVVVEREQWMNGEEFEHAVAAANLLPGPASTQLMIYSAWRLRGALGALVGGVCFITPGLVTIIALAAVFLARHPAHVVLGGALGAGAAVPAVAARTAWQLARPSWHQSRESGGARRWAIYCTLGAAAALFLPALVVLALLACGVAEIMVLRPSTPRAMGAALGSAHVLTLGGLGALAWVAFKVGALSYGGGFVIIPLMQHDVVNTYHWLSGAQFLNVVALGQVTPGPVVLTVAAVGYAAHGLEGATLATLVAFAPSFGFVVLGAPYFERLRLNATFSAFLAGAGASVIGAIGASAISLTLLLTHLWQVPVLVTALVWVFALRRSTPLMLVGAALVGAALSGVVPV
ncbi:MAG: chromate efflux transporter [Actinomycetota bacterium]|nr:chromate efflux transporter [Actinomycetota bacterium]